MARSHTPAAPPVFGWRDSEGIHTLVPGEPPSADQLEEMNQRYQKSIRESPLWDQMVNEFGMKEAEELLKECRIQLK